MPHTVNPSLSRAAWIMAICSLPALPACSSGSDAPDGGSPSTDSGTTPSTDAGTTPSTDAGAGSIPPTPTPVQGQIVMAVRDGSSDTTFRCGNGEGTLMAGLSRSSSSMPTTTLRIVCNNGPLNGNGRQFVLMLIRSALQPGTYTFNQVSTATETNTFGVAVTEGGAGFSVGGFASNAPDFTATLRLDEAAVGTGGRLRGTLTASWARVGIVTRGTVTSGAARPGGFAASFDVTQ